MTWLSELDDRYLVHRQIEALYGIWLAWDVRTEIVGNDISIPSFSRHDAQYWWWAIGSHFFTFPWINQKMICIN